MTFTHYHISASNVVSLFEIGECENCGCAVREVNGMKGSIKDVAIYKRIGLKKFDGEKLPDEIDVHEVNGDALALCSRCANRPYL